MMDTTSGAQYLQELSDFDTEILNYVWDVFGGMTRDEIVEYTHDPANIPEWKEPNGSSLPISLQTILKEVGMGNYLDINNEQISIDRLFNKLHS